MNKNAAFEIGVIEGMKKTALIDPVNLVGGAVGYEKGKEQRERGEKHNFGGKQLASVLFIPGGAGYQVGRYFGHRQAQKAEKNKKK